MINKILVLILYLAGVGAAAQIAKLVPVFTYIETAYELSLPQVTFVMSAIGVAAIVLGSVAGQVVVMLQLWRAMAISLVIAVLTGLALPMTDSFVTLVVLRLLEGIGHIGIVTAAPTLMVSLVAQRYAGKVLSLWASFFGVAFAVSQAIAYGNIDENHPKMFLSLHVLYFFPALIFCIPRALKDSYSTQTTWRRLKFLPISLDKKQFGLAMSFLFHAGTFTSMLTFAQSRIGGSEGIIVAPVLPIVSLFFVFLGLIALSRINGFKMFLIGASVCSLGLVAAISFPLPSYFLAFSGIGFMQAGIFASIGSVAFGEKETSALNGAYTQLGNLGNLLVPLFISTALTTMSGISIEIFLLIAILCAVTLQRFGNSRGD